MFPKTGKKLHRGRQSACAAREYADAMAAALKGELGSTHQAVKTVMSWTGASERTVKHWLAGTHFPNGQHLIALARHSDGVTMLFLEAADRRSLLDGARLLEVRSKLSDAIAVIDAFCEVQPADRRWASQPADYSKRTDTDR